MACGTSLYFLGHTPIDPITVIGKVTVKIASKSKQQETAVQQVQKGQGHKSPALTNSLLSGGLNACEHYFIFVLIRHDCLLPCTDTNEFNLQAVLDADVFLMT